MVKTTLWLLTLVLIGCAGGPQARPSRTSVEAYDTWVTKGSSELDGDSFKKSTTPTLATTTLAELAKPSVVEVTAGSSYGSGFVVGPNLVVTNLHVVEGQTLIKIRFVDGTSRFVSSIFAYDSTWDLVILNAPTGPTKALILGNSEAVKVGDSVVAVGNPKGLAFSISDGIISALRPVKSETIIQTTAPISPGSSGGPLMSSRGVVIGVTTLSLASGQALNFAYPVSILRELLIRAEVGPAIEMGEFAELTEPSQPPPQPKPKAVSKVVPEYFPSGLRGFWWGESMASARTKCSEFYVGTGQGKQELVVARCKDTTSELIYLAFAHGKLKRILWTLSLEEYNQCVREVIEYVGTQSRAEKNGSEEWGFNYIPSGKLDGHIVCIQHFEGCTNNPEPCTPHIMFTKY
jgi:hypothetical protein